MWGKKKQNVTDGETDEVHSDLYVALCFAGTTKTTTGNIRAGPSEKGAYGFSDVMKTNDVDVVIYDVTIWIFNT